MMREGIETVWDRFEMQQPPCKFCLYRTVLLAVHDGPCRIIPPHRIRGVCGADADLIAFRNLLDMIAAVPRPARIMAAILSKRCISWNGRPVCDR